MKPKSPIIISKSLDSALDRQKLGRSAASAFSNQVKRGGRDQSFASLLSRVYAVAADLVTELEEGGDPTALAKRSEALKSVAKTLPLLQQAEKNARAHIKRKAVEDLTDAELLELVQNTNFPRELQVGPGTTHSGENRSNRNDAPQQEEGKDDD